ncbi:tetratricopeptide repeat protein [Olsenella sp. DNF00959]|uniref:tetratricopeptide repeat protein n=1 Tax=Olsenella sp. DNF00959 TaxID=1476999 RepID=UPI000781B415|nr:tetratricopeptide repeat protein [Olsenella sp. DNF00959]KXB62733.1 Sel1 repeat protein [Olsenella sp. DNF00959]
MQKLSELPFRAYLGHPVIVNLTIKPQDLRGLAQQIAAAPEQQLPPEALEALPGHWDFSSDATLAWPRVDHDDGICLYPLCPCKTATHQIQTEHDLFNAFGLTLERVVDHDAPDVELVDILDWDSMPEPLKAHTQWLGRLFVEMPGVAEARADERLDPWRDPLYPDIVSAVLFPAEQADGTRPQRVFARVERCALDPDEPEVPYWEATLAAVIPDGEVAPGAPVSPAAPGTPGTSVTPGAPVTSPAAPTLQPGSRLWLGVARDEESGEVIGIYATAAPTIGVEDYRPELDAKEDGGLSLAIGERYYQEGMVSEGTHRTSCFELAEHFYQVSAERGNVRAICDLGYVYSYGRLGERDYDTAAKWFRKAAVLGSAEAAYKYGDLLWRGHGVQRDDGQARFYYQMAYKRARDEGDSATWGNAALALAGCHEYGRGCERDHVRARELYLEAEAELQRAEQDEPWHRGQLARAREGLRRLEAE